MRIAQVLDKSFLGSFLSFEELVHKIQPSPQDKFRALYIKLRFSRSQEAGMMGEILQNAIYSQNILKIKKAIQQAKALEQKCRLDYQSLSNLGDEIAAKLSQSQTEEAKMMLISLQSTLHEPLFPNFLPMKIEEALKELERLQGYSKGKSAPSLTESMYLLSNASYKIRASSLELMRIYPTRHANSIQFDNALRNYSENRFQFLTLADQIRAKLEEQQGRSAYMRTIGHVLNPQNLYQKDLEALWYELEDDQAFNVIKETDQFLQDNGIKEFIIQIE